MWCQFKNEDKTKDISFVEKVKQFSRNVYQNYFVTNVFTHAHTHKKTLGERNRQAELERK